MAVGEQRDPLLRIHGVGQIFEGRVEDLHWIHPGRVPLLEDQKRAERT